MRDILLAAHRDSRPQAELFSRECGIPVENLVKVFELEKRFHEEILRETDPAARRGMYADIYSKVHPLLRVAPPAVNVKTSTVVRFARELRGRSILDVGCGDGSFLRAVHALLPHQELVGLDVDPPFELSSPEKAILFTRADVIDFQVGQPFDVVFSDNVAEHIAPADLPTHLSSIYRAVKPGGRFVLIMPNRLFGPCDVTRILDCTYRGRVAAMGTHLNESTYTEMVPALAQAGFVGFKAVLPGKLGARGPRISTRWYRLLENSPLALNVLRRLRRRSGPIFKIPVAIISRKAA